LKICHKEHTRRPRHHSAAECQDGPHQHHDQDELPYAFAPFHQRGHNAACCGAQSADV
jgi:hypothetical protein